MTGRRSKRELVRAAEDLEAEEEDPADAPIDYRVRYDVVDAEGNHVRYVAVDGQDGSGEP